MLKCLYYLGRTICCFDDEALGKTWCFSVCCSSSDCILWMDFHSSYDLYSHWEDLYHLLVVWFIYSLGEFVSFTHLMIYILIGRICIILLVVWFILPLGKFVLFCSLYDLYSHLGNLYHFACHMIYILIGRIILLVIWFILPLGEFVSFCSSYDLYSRLGNLYHFARRMIYILIRRICIILLVV